MFQHLWDEFIIALNISRVCNDGITKRIAIEGCCQHMVRECMENHLFPNRLIHCQDVIQIRMAAREP